LFRGNLCNENFKWDPEKWSLKAGGSYSEVVVSSGLTAFGKFKRIISQKIGSENNLTEIHFAILSTQ
jgi:hypothetical protein